MRCLTLLATLACLAGSAAAADTPAPPATPQTPNPSATNEPAGAVRALYEGYYAAMTAMGPTDDLPAEYEWPAIADRHFTPELAARFKKALESEDLVMDWNILVNGQDFADLKIASVAAETVDDSTSKVTTVTSNMGTESTTSHDMKKTADGWRIADMTLSVGMPGAFEQLRLSDHLKQAGF